jgi:hypothetical protein
MQIRQTKLKEDIEHLCAVLADTNLEFTRNMDLLNSVLELQYLSQCLEFQDEVDRQEMSLWGLDPEEENGLTQFVPAGPKSPSQQKLTLSVDEDCLNCGLEKYRPAIKSAFKMACIQYRPRPVHFNKKRYERASIVNIKRQMVEDLVTGQVRMNESYRAYCKLHKLAEEDPFMEKLHQKIERFGK